MHFMIDMENSGSKGLQGVEYLAAEGKNNPRQLYLDMLKTFGRKDGLAIYRQLKNIKLE